MRARPARLVLLTLAAALATAAPAAAGTLTITYQIQSGSTDCCQLVSAPNLSGQFTFVLPAAGPATPISGAASLLSLQGVAATPTLDVGISLVSPVAVLFAATKPGFDLFGSFGLFSFRSGRSLTGGPQAFGNVLFTGGGIGGPTANLFWSFCCYVTSYTGSAVDLNVSVVGAEVSRVFVPEPRAVSLVALGLAAAAAVPLLRARRRSCRPRP